MGQAVPTVHLTFYRLAAVIRDMSDIYTMRSLSGGMKQRLLLARALYREPKLLFLDEATSHLDVANERLVNQAVRELALTKVIVAHRPETIASADRVLVMEQGRIVQELRPQAMAA